MTNSVAGSPASYSGNRLVLRRPDDWHVHLRDGAMLAAVAAATARQFARAIVMPNLAPPITTTALAIDYRQRIRAALPGGSDFQPLMTAYLTDNSNVVDIARGFSTGVLTACKLYPANATTNSAHGVTDIRTLWPLLERMQGNGMPLLVHGEVTDRSVDIFDREAVFIERVLQPLLADFPALKVVLEHITTSDAVQFVESSGEQLAATITPHHLMINRNAMFDGGIRPHAYCLPVAKRERHRLELRRAATSGNPKFFLGTDSAPHRIGAKESACGCAGIFCAPVALESYASVFDEEGALDRLQGFASEHGPTFYGLPLNESWIAIERKDWQVDSDFTVGSDSVRPFLAGTPLTFRYAGIVAAPQSEPVRSAGA